jgi:hypothetical protein
MLRGIALKKGYWIAYGVLALLGVWLLLMVTGVLGGWARFNATRLPPGVILTATLCVPLLAALCSLRLKIDWRLRIALFCALLACVPLLPIAFNSHPAVVSVVIVIFMFEEFGLIPLINKRWLARTNL